LRREGGPMATLSTSRSWPVRLVIVGVSLVLAVMELFHPKNP
jgi:hypothetical protein